MLLRIAFVAAVAATAGLGCSAIVDPDESKLGGGGGPGPVDAGPGDPDGSTRDSGPIVMEDVGPIGDDAGPPCTDPPSCEGGVWARCEGGARVTEDCPLGCATSGEPRCARMLPSNVPPSLWLDDAPDIDLSGDAVFAFDTSRCMAEGAPSEIVPQADGDSDVCVLSTNGFRIRAGTTVRVTGSRPFVIMATGQVRIEGTLDASAVLDEPGPGGFPGGTRASIDGRGPHGGGGGEHVGSFDDGGGGGGGACGLGGPGGVGGAAAGGEGGTSVARAWVLSPLVGGSGGGRGRGAFVSMTTASTNAGLGGAGGGALQISSPDRIEITGDIAAGGGGGLSGKNIFSSGSNYGSGGGGGSGGSILLESPAISMSPASSVRAAGGGGGGSASSSGSGDDGQNGAAVRVGRASGGTAADAFYGANGGGSGGGATLSGQAGGPNRRSAGNGGGGGGAAGCILFRNAAGTPVTGGVINPNAVPGLRALPVLRD